MKRIIKNIFLSFLALILIVTRYFVEGGDSTLADGLVINQNDSLITTIEVPSYYPEDNQCFDFWFLSKKGTHLLTVNDFSLIAHDTKNNMIKKRNSYLFWDDGSKEETYWIKNFELSQDKKYDKDKYIFFRTVFDVDNNDDYSLQIRTNYSIDSTLFFVDTTIMIKKNHRLTWSKFRVH